MSRRQRPHLPGAAFHVVARTQGRAAWFTPEVRSAITSILRLEFARRDADLLAFVIMPNHLHLVLRQGTTTLGRVLQPILQRIAGRVHRRHCLEGHVFERRYRAHVCMDADYLRNALVYTHLNPVRAGLCDDAAHYEWSSHSSYDGRGIENTGQVISAAVLEQVLYLFSADSPRPIDALHEEYRRFVAWRREHDLYIAEAELGVPQRPRPLPPPMPAGDRKWERLFRSAVEEPAFLATGQPGCRSQLDLRDIAHQVANEEGVAGELEILRSRHGGRRIWDCRHKMIRRMNAAGYRGHQIAKFLRISEPAVSRVLGKARAV